MPTRIRPRLLGRELLHSGERQCPARRLRLRRLAPQLAERQPLHLVVPRLHRYLGLLARLRRQRLQPRPSRPRPGPSRPRPRLLRLLGLLLLPHRRVLLERPLQLLQRSGPPRQPRMLGLRGRPRTLEQLERTLQKDSPVGQKQQTQKTEQPGPRPSRPRPRLL